MIFINWRGFSGCQQNMYDGALKKGWKNVDGLSSYKQPSLIILSLTASSEVAHGLSSTHLSMPNRWKCLDVEARVGVLEQDGFVMHREKILVLMEHLDFTFSSL